MATITANVVHVPQTYRYAELPASIQGVVLRNHEDKACQYDDWYSHSYDDTYAEMQNKGIYIEERGISFTGFGSQGDGASFTGIIDLKEFLEAHKGILESVPELYHLLGTAGQKPLADIECSLIRYSYKYSHENTVVLNWSVQWVMDSLEIDEVADLMLYIENEMQDTCRGYMRDLYAKLSQEYDWLCSEQCLIEDDLRYTAEGEIVW